MASLPEAPASAPWDRRQGVSFARLLWVAPLTVVAALVVNFLIKLILLALDPSLARMGQLGTPLITLTLEGAIAAVVVFALVAWLIPRPVFWYRILATLALLVSWLPDIALGIGGSATRAGMSVMGPLIGLGSFLSPGPPPGAAPRPAGGPPPGAGIPGAPLEHVLVL